MKNILLIGGDRRIRTAEKIFSSHDFNTSTLGLYEGDSGDIGSADIVVLPVPATRDGRTVFCPLTERKIGLDIIKSARQDAEVFAGGAVDSGGRAFTNLLELDDFALLNAVPTAEGAIATAISRTPFTLWNARVLVIGMGRVAKVLISRLSGFSCLLTVACRSGRDFGLLEATGREFIHTKEIKENAHRFDVIFNTVDLPLLDGAAGLESTLIIDLSTAGALSDPRSHSGYLKLPALPGKIAPDTAGEIIARTVLRQIKI